MYPSVPCTRIRCPSVISRVACFTPTTAGKPYSRAITAPWRKDRQELDARPRPRRYYPRRMVIAAQSEDRFDTFVGAVVDRIRPELVMLFGSRVRGSVHDSSDYDVMIVVDDGENAEACRKTAYDVSQRL